MNLIKEKLAEMGARIYAALQEELTRLVRFTPIDLIELRREIAAEVSRVGKYVV